ncbi:hypothetical protein BpOF4_05610 [Alkalihalophilus pseudofirmus OF4]|uniref:DUF8042 domain-containing protein n=1 Tax=Alkalihalophilus pseudofirmus (strain ATCC BAA-2126 / JCM 17055 / OF4) TaxID=398511 RepID=D3FYG1_ALKPO|nr:hypothetical protein [Alkalihalophilus pseudofirmus]ADC49184.1 hypothetical protein BpOF4_05610 [Alkalihalophilus pseudofirmus OF4]
MEKYRDVMEQSLDLVKTMVEGTHHLQLLLNEGRFEQGIILFEDIMKAYAAIERSIAPVVEEVEGEEICVQLGKVRESLELVLTHFEKKEFGRVKEVVQFNLLLQLKKVEADSSTAFSKYLVS